MEAVSRTAAIRSFRDDRGQGSARELLYKIRQFSINLRRGFVHSAAVLIWVIGIKGSRA